MAKLVAVCRDEIDFPFERRQIPLNIEDTLTMVMEIPETVIPTNCDSQDDLQEFVERYRCLDDKELDKATKERQQNIFALLAHVVPCVGCRRSVERLFSQLVESGQPALEPLVLTSCGTLTIKETFVKDPKLVYALFYVHGSKLIEAIPKSRRNRRCPLHSLETHKSRPSGNWIDVWELLSQECRDEVVLIDSEALLDTLENYLRKHRFCSECKSKVLKAYSILAGDLDGTNEKGFCGGLYDGLKSCPQDRHIHVLCDTDFIARLIDRAEPELAGGRREKHAKTLDIAQEEVLTCLGIHLWERLHRLWQKLKAEEQTWQMLFYLGVDSLRKRFEVTVEEKKGISRLEQVVEEISEAERVKEMKREQKRLKKKARRKEKCKCSSPPSPPTEKTDGKSEKEAVCPHDEPCVTSSTEELEVNGHDEPDGPELVKPCSDKGTTGRKGSYRNGSCGYDARELLGGNAHVRAECPDCSRSDAEPLCEECLSGDCGDGGTNKSNKAKRKKSANKAFDRQPTNSTTDAIDDEEKRLLQSMGWSLQADSRQVDVCSSDEDSGISEQDILHFKANQKTLSARRKELREKLRQKFDNLVLKEADSQNPSDSLTLNGITVGVVH